MDVLAHIPGYVSLLESKDRGRGLSQAADYLTPALEVGPQLRSARQHMERSSGGIDNNGAFVGTSITVPQGELWHVLGVQATITVGGAIDQWLIDWHVRMTPPASQSGSGGDPCIQLIPSRSIDVANDQPAGTFTRFHGGLVDIWAPAGSVIACAGATTGSAPAQFTSGLKVLAERLRV